MDTINTTLNEKKIVISGGTTGIGRAIAIKLGACGANLLIFGRHEAQLEEAVAAVKATGSHVKCYGIVADVAEQQGVKKVFDAADQLLNGVDVLINNAALAYQSITEGSYEEWQYIVNTNVLGYMACTHEGIKRMQNSSGHIINIGSMSAEVREENSSVYVATKSAIQGFSAALRKEVNPLGIKVTLIEPGAVDTDMQEGSKEEKEEKIRKMEMLPADDIAQAVYYCLTQPAATDIVHLQIRPHAQII